MPEQPAQDGVTVGVAEQGNCAVLVTVGPTGAILDRRRVELTHGLPTHPYHHEGAWAVGRYLDSPWARPIAFADAVALVQRVREAARAGAGAALDDLEVAVPARIRRVAIRSCPVLPPTVEERIRDNRAQVVADSVMYRHALASAAEARGWMVRWYERGSVFRKAAASLGRESADPHLRLMGASVGPPWQAAHKLAAAAALAVLHEPPLMSP